MADGAAFYAPTPASLSRAITVGRSVGSLPGTPASSGKIRRLSPQAHPQDPGDSSRKGAVLRYRRYPRTVMMLAMVTSTLGVTACGDGSSEEEAASPETVTVEKAAPEQTPEPKKKEKKTPAKQPLAGANIKVPDVVGKDHQLAQDTMQDAGLYSLREKDATGQGRLLLYDRNWTTVAQDPSAGTLVSEDQTITLEAKMDDE